MQAASIRVRVLLLEELTAVEGTDSGTSVGLFQASLRKSGVPDELAALNVEQEVSLAIEASGWLGRDDATRKEFSR